MPVRYEFDPLNRLVALDPRNALQPRRVIEGRASLDSRNRLVYRARLSPTPAGRPGQDVLLRAALETATGSSLTAVVEQAEGARASSQRVTLAGRWQADASNRLTFQLEKAGGRTDELVLDGAWDLDPRREIRYQLRRPDSSRRSAVHALRLAGAWDLTPESQLVYRLDGDTRSALAFQASLQSRALRARDGTLAYQVGIRLSDGRTIQRHIALFGTWKLNRDLSVSFELPGGRRQAATFEGTCTFRDRNKLTVALSTRRGEPTDVSVTFSRKWMKDAEWFVRAQRRERESELIGGVRVKF